VKKRTIKKLTLSRESIIRLDPSELREIAGGVTNLCTNSDDCTDSCQQTCACSSRLC
jgi:natural product precursor